MSFILGMSYLIILLNQLSFLIRFLPFKLRWLKRTGPYLTFNLSFSNALNKKFKPSKTLKYYLTY